MHNLIEIDHIGYAVRDIQTTAAHYVAAGWTLSEIYKEEVQHTKIAFLTKPGFTTIELVSPLDGPSPVDTILQNNGEIFKKARQAVSGVMKAVEDLYEEGFKPLFMPVASVAMDNREICYLYHTEVGLIEVVSKK